MKKRIVPFYWRIFPRDVIASNEILSLMLFRWPNQKGNQRGYQRGKFSRSDGTLHSVLVIRARPFDRVARIGSIGYGPIVYPPG